MANDGDKKPMNNSTAGVMALAAIVFIGVMTQLAATDKLNCLAGKTKVTSLITKLY